MLMNRTLFVLLSAAFLMFSIKGTDFTRKCSCIIFIAVDVFGNSILPCSLSLPWQSIRGYESIDFALAVGTLHVARSTLNTHTKNNPQDNMFRSSNVSNGHGLSHPSRFLPRPQASQRDRHTF